MAETTATVVVPTRNRPRQLAACLDALAALDHPRFEVVVADDGDVPLARVLARMDGRLELTVVAAGAAGPAAARNAALAHPGGEIVAFTDDDCLPRPGWLGALGRQLAAEPDALVGGSTVNGLPGNVCSAASQLVIDLVYTHYNADPASARFFASNNLAARADRLRAAGGFDPRFRTAEDRELCDRWRHLGLPLRFVPDAVVEHRHELTVARFARQHFRYGRGARRYHRARARRGSGSLARETAFEARLPLRAVAVLARERPERAAALAGLLVLWRLANAAGFAAEAAAAISRGESRPRAGAAAGGRLATRARRRAGSAQAPRPPRR